MFLNQSVAIIALLVTDVFSIWTIIVLGLIIVLVSGIESISFSY
jgi:hypothetical protein